MSTQHADNLSPREPPAAGVQDLAYWVTEIGSRQMPAFARTAHAIANQVSDESSSAAHLAREILQDPAMTTRVLKVANTVLHNPGQGRINTVSRAIVVLGFETVRRLCVSITFIDSLLNGAPREELQHALARSFLAATQARDLARRRKDSNPEEVYIATLLYHLGDMVFWCFASEFDPELPRRLQQARAVRDDRSPEEVERDVLGFSLRELCTGLNREWRLSALLEHALEHKLSDNPRLNNLELGFELADTIRAGWDSPELRKLTRRIAETLYIPVHRAEQMIRDNAEEAGRTLSQLGAHGSSRYIPRPPEPPLSEAGVLQPDTRLPGGAARSDAACVTEDPEQAAPPAGDSGLQLQILREISEHLESGPDLNLLLEMVLEGIHRGIGMRHTVFALLNRERTRMQVKLSLGENTAHYTRLLALPLDTAPALRWLLQQARAHRVDPADTDWKQRLAGDPLSRISHGEPFLAAPVTVSGRAIGLIYADRHGADMPVDQAALDSFKLFTQQASLGLSHLKSGKGNAL